MAKKIPIVLGAAALLGCSPLAAAAPEANRPMLGEDARIPFANFGNIRTFHAEGNDVLYLQDRRRNWYRAELIGPCFGLGWAHHIGIDNRGSSHFDRFSTLIVEGQRCQIGELTHSAEPERRSRKKARRGWSG